MLGGIFLFFFHLRAHNQHVDYSGACNWGCSLLYWSGIKGIRVGVGGGGGGRTIGIFFSLRLGEWGWYYR